MPKNSLLCCVLSLAAGSLLIPNADAEMTLYSVDFNNGETWGGFAQNAGTVTAANTAGVGLGGSDAFSLTIDNDPGSYAGATSGQFDLTDASTVTLGSITVADLDAVMGSFFLNIPTGQGINGIRFQVAIANSTRFNIVSATVNGNDAFQEVVFDVAGASLSDRTTFVNKLNELNTGAVTLAFSVNNAGSSAGSTFLIDNATVQIPEPASGALLGLCGAGFFFRRRCR